MFGEYEEFGVLCVAPDLNLLLYIVLLLTFKMH